MKRYLSSRFLSSLVCAVALWPLAAPVHADSDQDRARAAVQAGQVLPLKTLMERLERDHPGQVLEVELEEGDGHWLYEVRLLQAGGRLVKLKLDASTGEVLRRREHGHERERDHERRR